MRRRLRRTGGGVRTRIKVSYDREAQPAVLHSKQKGPHNAARALNRNPRSSVYPGYVPVMYPCSA